MSINPPAASKAASSSSKASSGLSQIYPATSATQQYFFSNAAQRSSITGGSSKSTPRNSQNNKPKHKQGKRFRPLDEDANAELFSMQNPHGRRGQQSITHLMQFSLPPRPESRRHGFGSSQGRQAKRNPTWGLGSGYHAVDKARYIHANYRFIVDPRGDYTAQAEDADVHLDWKDVLQIIASSKTQSALCPICLGEPTAPRMAKCGHMFCLPCLIRYMHSDDGGPSGHERKARWKKCPICEDSIYISETRPVRMYAGQEIEPREGCDVVLRLVRRRPGQTLAMPRESAEPIVSGEAVPWYFAAEVMDYARIMKGSEEYIIRQYDKSIQAIEQLEREDELMFGEDTEWTGRAIRMLNEYKEKVKGIGDPPPQPQKPDQQAKAERPVIDTAQDPHDMPDMYRQKHVDDVPFGSSDGGRTPPEGAPVPRTLHEMHNRKFEKPQPSEYLFYHALQHYYLSPLDIRILKAAFGSYKALPSSILPRVERISSGHVMDDELRKRVKYLAHLPYGCEVGFLECDWADTVSADTLAEFKIYIERRRQRNEEKEAREEKDRLRIEKAAEKEYAAVRRKRLSISHETFPSESLPGLVADGSMAGGLDPDHAVARSPPWPSRTTAGFESLASPSTSPSTHRTVWGTAAVVPSSPELHATLPRDHELHDDGWLQGWERDLLEEQSLAAQTDGLTLSPSGPSAKSTGKRGKKGKKITLMSTTARRHA